MVRNEIRTMQFAMCPTMSFLSLPNLSTSIDCDWWIEISLKLNLSYEIAMLF